MCIFKGPRLCSVTCISTNYETNASHIFTLKYVGFCLQSKDDAPSSPLVGYGSEMGSLSTGSRGYEDRFQEGAGDESLYQGQRSLQAELNRREDEQELSRDAAAQLEAELLAEYLLRDEMERSGATGLNSGSNSIGNGGFSQVDDTGDEQLEFLLPGQYKLPVISDQDSIPQSAPLQSLPPSATDDLTDSSIYGPVLNINRNYDDLQSDDPDQDDPSLLYTEGGLVFLNNNNRNRYNDWLTGIDPAASVPQRQSLSDLGFYDAPLTKEDEESLMYLKRFIENPVAPREEMELLRRERERPASNFDSSDLLLYGNPENVEDVVGNGYEELSSMLGDKYDGSNMGFERQERLDVKKPGPWYRTVNNYAFDKEDKVSKKSCL